MYKLEVRQTPTLPGTAPSKMFMPGYRDRHCIIEMGPLSGGLWKWAGPILMRGSLLNRIILLFEVKCIAAWTISGAFGWSDFPATLERMDCNFLVLGCGRRRRGKKGGADGQ